MKPFAALLLVVAAGAPSAALAQRSPPNACDSLPSHYEQGECLDKALKAADAALNEAYRKALASIDRSDLMKADRRRDWKQALQKAQRAWVAFRDADCGEPIGYEWFQGTGMGAAMMACRLDKTTVRTTELTDRYAGP